MMKNFDAISDLRYIPNLEDLVIDIEYEICFFT